MASFLKLRPLSQPSRWLYLGGTFMSRDSRHPVSKRTLFETKGLGPAPPCPDDYLTFNGVGLYT
jgi:hypothetical protein